MWCRQRVGPEVRYIAYYESQGKDLAHYAQWLQQRPYTYRHHVLPHDAKAKWLGTGKSVEEMARALFPNGLQGVRIGGRFGVDEQINAARMVFSRSYFDEANCSDGLRALQHYRRDYSDKLGQVKPIPVHDWSSHGAQAFCYSALDMDEAARVDAPRDNNEFGFASGPDSWMG